VTFAWRLMGTGVAIAATALLVTLSNVTTRVAASEDALVRLSWREVGERTRECRPPTEAELAGLPEHMRMDEVCEGRLAAWRLEVRVDGEMRVEREVRPSGAREDRPTYVFEELPVGPGPHELEVDFRVVGSAADSAGRSLRAEIDPSPRAVVLVTRDAAGEGLVLRRPGPMPASAR